MSTERPDNDAKPDTTEGAECAEAAEDAEDSAAKARSAVGGKGDSSDDGAKGTEEPASPERPERPGAERPAEPARPEAPSPAGNDVSAGAVEGVKDVEEVTEVTEVTEEVTGIEGIEGVEEPKARRGRSSVLIASVAAAVLLVGGGGAYLAASTTGGSGGGSDSGAPAGDGTPPPLALDGYTEGGTNGVAPGEPNPNGVTYRADGDLPGGPDSAPVYRSTGDVTSAEVARLAQALGVEGTPKIEGDTWKVGASQDGSGPSLQVNKDAPGTWTFSRYAPGTDNCQKADVCASASDTAAGGDPVSEAAAKKAAAPVLKAVGQDAAELDATQVAGAIRTVNADPEVGGLPTYGWTTGIQVGADGQVSSGSGNVKTPVKGGTYPVIGAEKALDLMNGPGRATGDGGRKGIGGCAGPVPLKGEDEASCEAATAAPAPEPVTVVDDAVFGLAARFTEGRHVLVPSWLFQVRPEGAGAGFMVTHPAVDPAYLTAPEPPSSVTPSPIDPDEPSGSAPKTRNVPVEGYTAQGNELTVSFWGGVCGEYSASADEANGKVTVTVTEKPSGKVCIMVAKAMERTVRLDKPLGDREVVGTNGKEIPKGSLTDRAPSAR
ncbi:hypothetical protein ACH40E_09495 [Streptomyces acidicola]|uniref:hypothetical protein n=1 Tax=Streptomyces acidicola TaxID=2596892 RepID=UPI0037AC4E85